MTKKDTGGISCYLKFKKTLQIAQILHMKIGTEVAFKFCDRRKGIPSNKQIIDINKNAIKNVTSMICKERVVRIRLLKITCLKSNG